MIAALDIRYQDFTFIDIGSGKGLVLLIASTYPFRKIIGVEFSPELNRVAKENIRNYQNSEQQCNDIQLVLRDVTEYVWPSDPLVLYMFNPFNEKIVQTLVTRIRESLEAHPRPLFILYKNPVANRVFEEGNFLKTVRFSKAYAIYKFKGSGV
jgi:tRNA A58 N-methylase Trm61